MIISSSGSINSKVTSLTSSGPLFLKEILYSNSVPGSTLAGPEIRTTTSDPFEGVGRLPLF